MFRWLIKWLKELGDVYTLTDYTRDRKKLQDDLTRNRRETNEFLQRLLARKK